MFFSFLILLLSPVAILATPHHLNHALHHRAIAARVAQPPQPSAPQNATFPTHKRRNTQRCRQKPISSSALPSSSSPSSSPVYHPTPTTYAQPTPTTTQHQVAPVITTSSSPTPVQQQPAPTTQAPSSGSGGFLAGAQTGQGTFYSTGLGSCGITNQDTDHIAAVSHLLYDNYPGYNGVNPNENPVCGKKTTATYQGKSVTITVTDRCTGCALTDLDFAPSAFDILADPSVGRISGMTWVWA